MTVAALSTSAITAEAANLGSVNGYLYTITDANGNIIESAPLCRSTYVNSYYTLAAGASFNSYQYTPSHGFGTSFYAYKEDGTYIDGNHYIRLKITNAASIGGTESAVASSLFSTNHSDLINYSSYLSGFVSVYSSPVSSSKPYYRAVITNTSGTSIRIRILVSSD